MIQVIFWIHNRKSTFFKHFKLNKGPKDSDQDVDNEDGIYSSLVTNLKMGKVAPNRQPKTLPPTRNIRALIDNFQKNWEMNLFFSF